MAKGMPSLLALLGLVAVAGYQHRDKIAGALGDMQKRADSQPGEQPGGLDGLISGIGGLFGGDGNADDNVLTGGLADLMDRFKSSGQGARSTRGFRPTTANTPAARRRSCAIWERPA